MKIEFAPRTEVAKVHPQAMPVILTTNDECDLWMSGDWEQASKLQRPLADGSLKIVASGEKEDFG
jgi:putative SOS response-associated peptidase YedK